LAVKYKKMAAPASSDGNLLKRAKSVLDGRKRQRPAVLLRLHLAVDPTKIPGAKKARRQRTEKVPARWH
jgi:hypothetical protein